MRPTQSGVNWADIESLFVTCGAYIEEREGSRVYVELNDVVGHFHRPHPKKEAPKGSRRLGEAISEGGGNRTMMEHKGYRATVTFDDAAGVFHGEVVDTRDVIVFEGTSAAQLRKEFEFSVDDYLKVCEERGRTPDKPFSGKIPLPDPSGGPPGCHRSRQGPGQKPQRLDYRDSRGGDREDSRVEAWVIKKTDLSAGALVHESA